MKNKLILEPSTNTHIVKSEKKIEIIKNYANGDKLLNIKKSVVLHGEHGPIGVSGIIYKVTQKEYNPVTKAINNSWD